MYNTTGLWLDNADDFKCAPWLHVVASQKLRSSGNEVSHPQCFEVLATCSASGCLELKPRRAACGPCELFRASSLNFVTRLLELRVSPQ